MMKSKLGFAAMKFFVFTFLLISFYGMKAQDTSSIEVRKFNSLSLKKYKLNPEFTYETLPPEKLDLFSLIKYYLGKLFRQLFSPDQEWTIYKAIFYLLMIGSVLMIILNLMGVDIRKVFVRESQIAIPYAVAEENIREMNMDDLIAEAFANKQWRLCIRYQYLKMLRLLTDRELINWKPGKTNMDYYCELKNADAKTVFLSVTNDFENAWYGNLEVTEENYLQTKSGFENFYEQIKRY